MTICAYYPLQLKLFSFYALHHNQQTEGKSFPTRLCSVAQWPHSPLTSVSVSTELKRASRILWGLGCCPFRQRLFGLVLLDDGALRVLMNVFDVFTKLATTAGVSRFQFGGHGEVRDSISDSAIIDGQDLLRRERSNPSPKSNLTLTLTLRGGATRCLFKRAAASQGLMASNRSHPLLRRQPTPQFGPQGQ